MANTAELPAVTCFSRVGLHVPNVGGDCVCGDFVRFDLASRRVEHFMVCPVVEEIVNAIDYPTDLDEAAVKVGIDAINQNRGTEGVEQSPQETLG